MLLGKMVIAIGRALGITQAVGHANQTQGSQTGGLDNIAKAHKSANQELKRKRSSAKAVILAPLPKAETLLVPTRTKKSLMTGTQQATPARQSAQSKPNSKPKAAKLTTAAKSSSKDKRSAQAATGVRGKQLAAPVRKTRQHAK